ncbi:inositol monophosphatase family protein [Cognatishimia maritima]|uniref:Inositol-1-monophosphatase n=1 Tax=Cognatishimia maritima TaxID=870908 RepID=A0A1M5QSS9_9RHOB|nr:inositol monophosphatase family protein [Cognatishimia maritima]SHH16769.1 histidinol-phosphatase, inositol monophosphatase family [Cognatishimia maritima]
MSPPIEKIGEIAERIAREASAIPMSHFRAPLDIDAKADESPVTVADRETEAFIRDALQSAFPGHGIFGEEYGISGSLDGETWIIDPIDGTRTFITGSPLFGMLMGYLVGGRPKIGLVRMPALDETYIGLEGQGATLNGARIRCRDTRELGEAMIYVNEAERLQSMNPDLFGRLCRIGHTRRMAYDCYPHALVASGQIDAVVDCRLEPYDFLPLVGLIKASGGVITDWEGNDLTMKSDGKVVTATTPELLQAMLDVVNG